MLSYFLSQTKLPHPQTRWRMYLQSCDFDIIPGAERDNILTDALTRVYKEQDASAEMTFVDPTEKKNIKGPYSAMASNIRHNLRLAHTINPLITQSFFSTTPLNPFSIPQHLSMWNTKDVPFPDSLQTDKNSLHPCPVEQELVRMERTLEQGIEGMQVANPAFKVDPLTLAKPRYSSKLVSHCLLLLHQEFIALQGSWNHLCALTQSTTAREELMPPLPNWNQ